MDTTPRNYSCNYMFYNSSEDRQKCLLNRGVAAVRNSGVGRSIIVRKAWFISTIVQELNKHFSIDLFDVLGLLLSKGLPAPRCRQLYENEALDGWLDTCMWEEASPWPASRRGISPRTPAHFVYNNEWCGSQRGLQLIVAPRQSHRSEFQDRSFKKFVLPGTVGKVFENLDQFIMSI